MPEIHLQLVTFNENEAEAIQSLFDDLGAAGSKWSRKGPKGLELDTGSQRFRLQHTSLQAQGNVVAATQLAELFAGKVREPDYVIFYGCAGAVEARYVGHAFLVGQVSYASLGTVAGGTPTERVTLKNKWLCDTDPREVEPLAAVRFGNVLGPGLIDLQRATLLTPAHVVATDKVIKISPASSPPPVLHSGPPRAIYKKGEWSYAETLAYAQHQSTGLPVLVEMESFGIGTLMKALQCEDRVVIIRIVTDDLAGHSSSDAQQKALLQQGRVAVAGVLAAILNTSMGT